MNLPADIPSYLSSQGTLSEPQEGYSNSENGSHQQLMPSHANGYVHKGTDGNIMLCSSSKSLFLHKGCKIKQIKSDNSFSLLTSHYNECMLWCVSTGVCYGEVSSDVDPDANGMLGSHVGSFFAGRSSFHRSEPREGQANVPNGNITFWIHTFLLFVCLKRNFLSSFMSVHSLPHQSPSWLLFVFLGGAGPLVICSDCYDNANIYSRTREYCPYAYLTEDDPLVAQISRDGHQERDQRTKHTDTTLESFISQQNASVFLTNHEPRLPPSQLYSTGEMNTLQA